VIDLAAAYEDTQSHLSELVRSLSPVETDQLVPASPSWTVRDVVAHVTGVAADAATGRIPPGLDLVDSLIDSRQAQLRDRLTAKQVSTRRDQPLERVLEEWSAVLEDLLPMIRGERPFPEPIPLGEAILPTDLAVHAQDIRGAVGHPGERDSAGVSVALVSYCAVLGLRMGAAGLPALRIRYGEKERLVGEGEPGATWEGDRYEIFRALAGRRSTDQIASMSWTGDPAPYLPLIPAYGPRTDAIIE
jgi:uncharacterized protein (TIGR03083 family)